MAFRSLTLKVAVWDLQVPGADGALAVVVMPRYVLHNSLGLPLQHRQQGTTTEKEVAPGGAKALRWTNSALPKRLCLRVQEAGWLWSGGVALDSPGDFFVKIRHRWGSIHNDAISGAALRQWLCLDVL